MWTSPSHSHGSSLVPVVNPFLQKYIPDGTSDAYSSNSEIKQSSQAPSHFFDLIGPEVTPVNRDSVHLGLQEAGALPSLSFMQHTFAPSKFSSSNKVSKSITPPVPRASSLPDVYSSSQSSPLPSAVVPKLPKEVFKQPTHTRHFFPPMFHSTPSKPSMIRTPSSPPIMTHAIADPRSLQTNSNGSIKASKNKEVEDNSSATLHALVVDDDQLTRRLMLRMLQVNLLWSIFFSALAYCLVFTSITAHGLHC